MGNVPEVNSGNKFSKHQKFTLTPDYLFKRTLILKSENWWLWENIGFVKIPLINITVIFLYSRNLKLFYLFDMTLLWGLKFLGNVFVLCQSLGLIMLTIHKLFRLVCPSRLKYWCYFRWVLGYEDYHLICKEDLGKYPRSFLPLSNAWVILTREVMGHKLLCWLPCKFEMYDPESSEEPGAKNETFSSLKTTMIIVGTLPRKKLFKFEWKINK